MHIKQVIIRGFKTYKEQVSLVEDFDRGVNVVVGFNGSGKSNFFNAILFVISDHFGTLRAETRKELLHAGTGPAVLTAFVEVVFDNSDRRMPIDKDEVRVRRSIAAKKDDYMLDGRHATKVEVFNLLESCGFSKSNPYYIVQQGRIAELTLMNDYRRLELMKEISGASVFDERKAESQKILEEMSGREKNIERVIDFIRQRIRNLKEEQEELFEYQRMEHRRRCIEFELTDRDWRTAQDRIVALERDRQDASLRLNEAQRQASQIREELNGTDGDIEQLSAERQRSVLEREEVDRQRIARSDDLSRLRLELEDEQKRASAGEQFLTQARADLVRVEAELATARQAVAQQRPALQQKLEEKRAVVQKMQLDEARRDQLLAKQRRLANYSSVAERNTALKAEVSRHEARQEKHQRMLADCQTEMEATKRNRDASNEKMAELRRDIQRLQIELDQKIANDLNKVTIQLEQCSERKRLTMQDRESKQRSVAEADREALGCQSRIDSTMPRAQRSALASIMHWVERQGLRDSVYGTLLENIEVPPEYHIAAECTAGGALFNLLVKDDTIAAQIITKVRTENLGSIVCTPLNRISATPKAYGYPSISGVKPLVEVVKASEVARLAVQQIFGKTLVCQSLELCDEVSRKYGFDTITADGDKVSSRGTLSGGYQDPARFLRINFSMKLRSARTKRHTLVVELEAANQRAEVEAEELTQLHGQRNTLQEDRSERRSKLNLAIEELHAAERQVTRHQAVASRHQERIAEIQNIVQECRATIEGLQQEMSTDRLGELSASEGKDLQALAGGCKALSEQYARLEEDCHNLECKLKDKEAHAQDVLQKRKAQLDSEIMRAEHGDHQEHIDERGRVVAQLSDEHVRICQDLERIDMKLLENDTSLDSKRSRKDRLRQEDGQLQERIAEADAGLDDVVSSIHALAKKKNEADEKRRTMTCVSADVAEYKQMSGPGLLKELSKTTGELAKFEHVNKKAVDQFATFTTQLQELEENQKKQQESREAIEGFMQRVDEQKEATLQKTLSAVDEHFRFIFSELVDGGAGKLRMLRPSDAADDDADAAASGLTRGVRVEVSFTGNNASSNFLTMAQLSGGQKTVVAIALIFSIQRLEPAPFYLFDEIDAALDTQYRTAVAKLIEKDSKNAQMVITTFRSEIIEKADKFYRVYQQNRVSRIECVSRQEARQVIEEQARLELVEG
mmetsp:Transcript_117843/g.375676  ORF Transcript_117843/g.375676 Transcript_117843/m.375676 type:complete len:1202 (+) Transcript_117843:129-3734(+)